jgi:hypothetical protein
MHRACVAALLVGVVSGAAHAAEPKSPPTAQSKVDAEFLEFLGSLDTEDEEWREYLENRPIRATAGKPAEQKASPSQSEPRQPDSGKHEQVNKS